MIGDDGNDRITGDRGTDRIFGDAGNDEIFGNLDPDVIEKFKATGKGWQNRINEILKGAKV